MQDYKARKKGYTAPALTVHGTVEDVTQANNYKKAVDAVYPGGFACDPTGGLYGCATS